jgi:uncharacterized transporter YbjL
MEFHQDIARATAVDGALPDDRHRLSRRRNQHQGFLLGVGAVLFVALGMGWFAPKSVPSAMVGTLGLALFLYGVGIQYGKQFFIG